MILVKGEAGRMDVECASRRLGLQYRCDRESVTGDGILETHHYWIRCDGDLYLLDDHWIERRVYLEAGGYIAMVL